MVTHDTAHMNAVIADALNNLRSKDYRLMFRREATCLYCHELDEWITPENFTLDESYYFEDIENPDADRMLYAISLSQKLKGFLIDSCNVYTDNISYEMMQKLQSDKIISGNDFIKAIEQSIIKQIKSQRHENL